MKSPQSPLFFAFTDLPKQEESVIVHDTKVKKFAVHFRPGDLVRRRIPDSSKQSDVEIGQVQEVHLDSTADAPVKVLYQDGNEADYEHADLVLVERPQPPTEPPPPPQQAPSHPTLMSPPSPRKASSDPSVTVAIHLEFLGRVSTVVPGWTFSLERDSVGAWKFRSHGNNPFISHSFLVNDDLERLLSDAVGMYRDALQQFRLLAEARLANASEDVRRVDSLLGKKEEFSVAPPEANETRIASSSGVTVSDSTTEEEEDREPPIRMLSPDMREHIARMNAEYKGFGGY